MSRAERLIGARKIAYQIEGEGHKDFLFLFHGWGAPLSVYKSVISLFSEKYTVVAPEFPGFGASPEPDSPIGMAEYAAIAEDFISSFGVERVVLFGHSFGGRVIIKMHESKSRNFDIDKIILADSAGIKPKKSPAVKAKIALYKTGKKILSLPPVKALFPSALEKLQASSGSADYRAASPMMRRCFTMVVNEDLTELLPKISSPTLLIWGENDDATPVSDGRLMEKLIPDAGLVVLEGAGHYSFLDSPYVFSRVLSSFLTLN